MSRVYRRVSALSRVLLAAAAASAISHAALAQETRRAFNIPAEGVADALNAFSQQSGWRLLFPYEAVEARRTRMIKGVFTDDEVLAKLLQAADLTVASRADGIIILKSPARPESATLRTQPTSWSEPVASAAAAPAPTPVAAGTPSAATGAGPGGAATSLEDIIVTAQRRSERLQDVPVAVTTVTSKQMQQAHLTDIKSLSAIAPSLYTGGFILDATALTVSIRGISSLSITILQEPGVGVYIDGVYIPRTDGANLGLVDLQQVEVLRGAQGTLFGRNTLGGALTLTTNQPKDRLEGSVEGTVGNYGEADFTGIVNAPIVPGKLDARLVYAHLGHGGYTNDTFLNRNIGGNDANYVRFGLKAMLSDVWTLSATADYLWDNESAEPAKILYVRPGSLTSLIPAASGHPSDSIANYVGGSLLTDQANFAPQNPLEAGGVAATLTGSFNFATFRNIIGYRHMHVLRNADADGTPYDIIHDYGSAAYSDAFSEEAQLFGKAFNNRLDWIGGLYYFDETGGDGVSTAALPSILNAIGTNADTARNISYAVYGQATYSILTNLKFTAGVRYTYDQKSVRWVANSQNITTGVITCNPPTGSSGFLNPATCESAQQSTHFGYVPFTLKLEYQPARDINLYGSYTVGYRSGGFPNSGGKFIQQYQPFGTERTSTIELGAKTQWFDGHLRANLAAYTTDYDNIQLVTMQLTSSNVPYATVLNSGTGKLWGGELEVAALIGKLELDGSVGVLNGTYLSGPYVGRPFLIVPDETFSLGATYPVDTAFGVLTLHANYDWRSRVQFQYTSPAGSITDILNGSNAVGLLNASVTLDLRQAPVSIELWGKNLTNEHYVTWVSNNSQTLGGEYGIAAAPLTFGATVRYRFGD